MRRSEVTPGSLRGDMTSAARQVDGQGRWIVIDGRRWMWKKERGANLVHWVMLGEMGALLVHQVLNVATNSPFRQENQID